MYIFKLTQGESDSHEHHEEETPEQIATRRRLTIADEGIGINVV